MRFLRLLAAAGLVLLGGCWSSPPPGSARLNLNNPRWDRVNVQFVMTRGTDCDSRGDEFIDSREVLMPRNKIEIIDVPNGATLCWRRDRNPDKPEAGVWTGWTKATLFPGRSADADL